MRPTRLLLVVLLATGLGACGGGSKKSSSSSTTVAAVPNTITIQDFAFHPNPITVKSGVTVTVHNSDGATHTTSSDDKKSFDTKEVSGGSTATFVAPTAAGTYAFHCNIHPSMHGTLIVTA